MNNMAVQVNIEGMKPQVMSDWVSLLETLKLRKVSEQSLRVIYDELNAGVIVTTRGLTLAKHAGHLMEDGATRPLTTTYQFNRCA